MSLSECLSCIQRRFFLVSVAACSREVEKSLERTARRDEMPADWRERREEVKEERLGSF
jgi:hypothetical protein